MSTDSTTDGIDDLPPTIDEDAVSTGAAADSSDLDDRLKALPRLLRYAMLASDTDVHIARRLAAEIDELCPGLALNPAGLAAREGDFGSDLGTEPGLADICIAGHTVTAQFFKVELRDFPAVAQLAERCFAIPAFATAHPFQQPGFKAAAGH